MAETLNTWSDGSGKWQKRVNPVPFEMRPFDLNLQLTLPYTLVSCDIKSDTVAESWVVKHDGVVLKDFENDAISYWSTRDNVITLNFVSGESYNLLFFSPADAIMADFRLYLIMNGHSVVGCDDASLYACGNITGITVSFS